ncbi:SPFH domain-containing protein [Pseudomarimonas arenosa]|uniref:Band 7 domain-containing protein n=1 Tax=Pseudomarimonas arenosa TaxID=2774145 RepID=A0AAW3ZQB9_9GAMM|nr:SPFH domain-containing protein [Pseudomarimonas arenosa]MBD8528148.1 hypothetical protein [Pseudomarimonas arenosa]
MSEIRERFHPFKAGANRRKTLVLALALGLGWMLWSHPPVESVAEEQFGLRVNRITGGARLIEGGSEAWVWPLLHQLHAYSTADQTFAPFAADRIGLDPLQSADGLSVWIEASLQYRVDPTRLAEQADLPSDLQKDWLQPIVEQQLRAEFARYTMAELLTDKRQAVFQSASAALQSALSQRGIELRAFQIDGLALHHQGTQWTLHERAYKPMADADSHAFAPLLSKDGLSVYADMSMRYALDAEQLTLTQQMPRDLQGQVVDPQARDILGKAFARYTLHEIYNDKRQQLQDDIRKELASGLKAKGFVLNGFLLGDVSLLHLGMQFSLHDRIFRPQRSASVSADAPLQTSEGLSIGVELAIRYALDTETLAETVLNLPADVDNQRVAPLVDGVIYRVLSSYSAREIFSSKRSDVQQEIVKTLAPLMQRDGLVLRSVTLGNIDLPRDYKAGMDRVLQTELQNEQMKYTLQLKEKEVRQSELQAEAEKVRREKQAEAAAREQVIAAKAQEEAMRHVLPFKQQQVEQKKLEAEADRLSRIKTAEGVAEARKIEAAGEAESRQKLADAEAYRMERLGKVASAQLERDGALIDRYPLMIQKTLADKLSDKVQVIIAPPPADGGFIGNTLLGANDEKRGRR